MLEALRVRDFRLLWSGRLVSLLGTWLLTVAVPAHVLALTGSLTATGLTLAAEYLPLLLLGPVAGVLSDRWDRRRLMIATDVFRMAAVALLLLVRTPGSVWIVYVALAAESAGSILFRPAAQAHVPAVLGTGPLLSSANALNGVTDGTVRLVGAPLGAVLLVAFGYPPLIWADIGSYLLSALAILATAPHRRAPAAERVTVRSGFVVLHRHRTASRLLAVSFLFLTANAALSALLIPFGVRDLGGARQAGLVISALGVGFLAGAPVVRTLLDRLRPRYLLGLSLFCTGAGFAALFSARTLPLALPAAVVIGLFGSMVLVTQSTTLQRTVPNEELGRATALFVTAEALATLIGAVSGPALAGWGGITLVALASCLLTAATAVLALRTLP